ncbi:hypothetical protein DN752_21015 [Echinicola strongylocentroti]|uniref:Uncharacterized protein n=1 Tax=Echinicola strongylocentroti TaxID=1795355 RepID=A0A2Z4INK7_9BACT|nr:hypothetical protein [Echinicola strongylocentroti]AWW32424.1 hypothetical protein DN752_21015 [Echinicola strongylocentroti]
MRRSFLLEIPIKPHLKKYLEEFYTLPYSLNQKDELGLFLFHLLRRREFRSEEYFSINHCTESLEVKVSSFYTFDKGCKYMSAYQAHLLNKYLEEMMMRHCLTWIEALEMANVPNRRAIFEWIEKYELDGGSKDWYHLIKQRYFRHRKYKENRKTAVRCVPKF